MHLRIVRCPKKLDFLSVAVLMAATLFLCSQGREPVFNRTHPTKFLHNSLNFLLIYIDSLFLKNIFFRPFFLGLKASGPAIRKSFTHLVIMAGLFILRDKANS